MRRIHSRERRNGMKYCTFCKPKKVSAIYRNQYLLEGEKLQFACQEHKHLLVDGSRTITPNKLSPISSEYLSEGEYQIYRNLRLID